jgi:putative transposase
MPVLSLYFGQRVADRCGSMDKPIAHYKNHRFPPEIIARAVWLHYRFPLSLRHVEEMLLERGIVVSYEPIRRWGRKHGPDFFCRP